MKALSPRLECVSRMLDECDCVCDVGTDHAFLPIYLIQSGKCRKVLACDLRTGPLENARKNVTDAGLENEIRLRLSDGLDSVGENEADEIVIAGMGGILISQILSRCGWAVDKTLVLQPQSHTHVLRSFLVENGIGILQEKVCEDSGRLYCVMKCRGGVPAGEKPPYYSYYGELPSNDDELSRRYLTALSDRLSRDAGRMSCSNPSEAQTFYNISDTINALVNS